MKWSQTRHLSPMCFRNFLNSSRVRFCLRITRSSILDLSPTRWKIANLNCLILPRSARLCLRRENVPETPNHRLQTLVSFFGVDPGQAHRALDDARACLKVGIKIFDRLQAGASADLTVGDLAGKMLRRTSLDLGLLYFSRFSMNELRKDASLARFIDAAKTQTPVQLTYKGGSRPGQARTITPNWSDPSARRRCTGRH